MKNTANDILSKARKANGDFSVLPISVYRNPLGECTNGGVSSKSTTLYVICPEGNMLASEVDAERLVRVRDRHAYGNIHQSLVRCDTKAREVSGWAMFGGNYAIGDTRFAEYISSLPLPIHDRYE